VRHKYRQSAIKKGYRSGLEEDVCNALSKITTNYEYERHKLLYQKRPSTYTPDIRLANGIYIEIKGRFTSSDRQKHILVKSQNPDVDVRFVFANSNTKISRKSKTTYGDWCTRHGFVYADMEIPKKWVREQTKLKKEPQS
jgi:hypothetical protein